MKIGHKIRSSDKPFFSLEFFPPKDPDLWNEFFEMVDKIMGMDPLFCSVTCGAGGSNQGHTLEIAARLKKSWGLEVMPHLTCVEADAGRIDQALAGFEREGIDNVMALRGDKPKNAGADWIGGDFRHAADLVAHIRKSRPGMGIGVAGYPAPHPESPTFRSDRDFLAEKIGTGADFVVSQLFFDSREYFSLVEDLRARGITVPIVPGILPIQSLASISRTLSMCGANIPGKLYLNLMDAHNAGGTEAVRQAGLDFAVEQIQDLLAGGVPGIHLYTLNKADLCLKIKERVGI